jgi:hypothetical protein
LNLALLSESPSDEAAIKLLVEYVLREPFTIVQPGLRARGWPNVEQVLPPIIRHLHFNTKADGLVVVVDSDDSPVHTEEHEAPGYHHAFCRICRLRAAFRRATKNLPPAQGRTRVLRAVGLAVPAIEAWLLCGRDTSITEDAWLQGQEREQLPYTRADLKMKVYGTTRPSLPFQTRRAVEEISRQAGDTRRMENDFPRGFGALVRDLRAWR